MAERRIWRTPKAGQIKNLSLQYESMSPLKPDQVRIKTRAVGLNFADIFALTGLYSATPSGAFIPGLELSGEIEEVGTEVSEFKSGDRVMAVTRFGGYVDRIDISPAYCSHIPSDWSMEQAAAFLVQTATAWYALKNLGNAQPGQRVLIHSAAGGVGLQAMKICQAMGLMAIGTVRSRKKKEFLQEQGFSHILVRSSNFLQELQQELSGAPLHLVLDAIGGKVQQESFEALAPMGRLVIFGAATFTPGKNRPNFLKLLWHYLKRPKFDPLQMISANKSILAFNLIWLWQEWQLFHSILQEINQLAIKAPYVGHSYPFEKAHEALEILRSGKTIGKVVLKV